MKQSQQNIFTNRERIVACGNQIELESEDMLRRAAYAMALYPEHFFLRCSTQLCADNDVLAAFNWVIDPFHNEKPQHTADAVWLIHKQSYGADARHVAETCELWDITLMAIDGRAFPQVPKERLDYKEGYTYFIIQVRAESHRAAAELVDALIREADRRMIAEGW